MTEVIIQGMAHVCDPRRCLLCMDNICKMNEHQDNYEPNWACWYCSRTSNWIEEIMNLEDKEEIKAEIIKLCRELVLRGNF